MNNPKLIEFEVRTMQGRRIPYLAEDAAQAHRYAEQNGHLPISIIPLKEARGK